MALTTAARRRGGGAQRVDQLVAKGADGGRHQPCGLFAVAGLERCEQLPVLGARAQAVVGGAGAQREAGRVRCHPAAAPRYAARRLPPAAATLTCTARFACMKCSAEAASSRSSVGL